MKKYAYKPRKKTYGTRKKKNTRYSTGKKRNTTRRFRVNNFVTLNDSKGKPVRVNRNCIQSYEFNKKNGKVYVKFRTETGQMKRNFNSEDEYKRFVRLIG